MTRCRQAARPLCSLCSISRSPLRSAIASCFAIPRRSARSVAARSLICVRPRGSGAHRSGLRSLTPPPSPMRTRACRPCLISAAPSTSQPSCGIAPCRRANGMALIQRLGLLRLPTPKAEYVVAPAAWLRLKDAIHATLTAFHSDYPNLPGTGVERLRLQLELRFAAPVFAALLQGLARNKEVALDGAWVRLPGHEVRLSPADEVIWAQVGHYIAGEGRFRPARVRDIAGYTGIAEPAVRRIFKLMGRIGKVDEIAQDHFFLRGTVTEIVQIDDVNRCGRARRLFHRRATARSTRQRPQGRDTDTGVLRSARRYYTSWRSAPAQQAPAGLVRQTV